jgi:ABC-type multidrug transport system fused ATPase/permease subunit
MAVSQFIASFIVGYITSWQLSLVLTGMLPLLGIGGWFMAKAMDQGQATNESYVNAGAMSQEILKEIKTVASFANFDYEKERYRKYIDTAMKNGIKQGFKSGFGIGFIVFVVYNSYALAVGYGSYLIANSSTNKNSGNAFGAGEVIIVLFSIIFGCFSLGQSTPYLNAIISACRSARGLFYLLDREPKIDLSTSKLKPDKSLFSGKIIFEDVCYSYPSKPNNYVLKNFNLTIESGKKIVIVGKSGSGKSTILSLIERLYDPTKVKI